MANFIYILQNTETSSLPEALGKWYIAKFDVTRFDGTEVLYLNKQGIWANPVATDVVNYYYYDTKEEAQAMLATTLDENIKPDHIVGV